MEKVEGAAAEQPLVPLCSVCKQELVERSPHEREGDCELAEATPNEFKLSRGTLRRYKPEHQMLVLTHGPIKWAFAFNIWSTNQACNHWQQIAAKYMHMRPATQRMIQNYDWVLRQALEAHGWDLPDILPICEELAKIEAGQGPKLIVPS